jgi:SAM-dependent methyltransferase
MLLKCLHCHSQLQKGTDSCVCPQCGADWPITGGIPRFFQVPDYYWGEVGRGEAQNFLTAARSGSWLDAVHARFPNEHDMAIGLLDMQRASWATMLGLDADSVVLDVGSGYGAITHSLSRLVGHVYSVEAIPERIEFTYERLRQEQIENVTLVQASATELPLMRNSFDLAVSNGVLEWVGEWDTNGSPRNAQLRFLRSLYQLLKDDGVLVIGIENRFGYGLLLGHNDHSGIPYTSVVPRSLASFMLRHSKTPHHRTTLNPNREYRTFTYSEDGYRELLGDAGFLDVSCYWAEPGYNQPYNLIPLSRSQWVMERYKDQLEHPSPAPRNSWRSSVKRAVADSTLMRLTLPEFVLIASKNLGRSKGLHSWIHKRYRHIVEKQQDNALRTQPIPWSLHTVPFNSRVVVRLGDPSSGGDFAYIKACIGSEGSCQTEAANRSKVKRALEASSDPGIRVPQDYGNFHAKSVSYWMESAAEGTHLYRVVRRPGYFAESNEANRIFSHVFEKLVDLTETMQGISDAPTVDPDWHVVPEEFQDFSELCAGLEHMRLPRDSPNADLNWVQHGDLSIENITVDLASLQVTVFDWVDMARGFPPLYDFFELLFSVGYLIPAYERIRFASEFERWKASFDALFFMDTQFARLGQRLMLQACERLKVQPELIPSFLIEFLLLRTHYYRAKSPVQCKIHLRLLQNCLEQSPPVFGRFPFNHARVTRSYLLAG